MLILVAGLVVFIGIHLLPTAADMRRGLAGRLGEGAYKGIFSLIALVGFALIIYGFSKAKFVPLWSPPSWGRHVAMTLMLPVFPLLIAAYLPGKIAGLVRHPMVTAIKFWALAHLFVRGDLKSLLLFGALLAFAVYDRISLKHREAAGLVKIRSGPAANDAIAIVLGLVVYYAFAKWGHLWLIGVPIIP